MTYFLCLAVPPECAEHLPLVFDKRIHQSEASQWPIGQATQGKNRSWTADSAVTAEFAVGKSGVGSELESTGFAGARPAILR
jgi:hypothetical protein